MKTAALPLGQGSLNAAPAIGGVRLSANAAP